MARIVMKFGGTSVADTQRIAHAATHVQREVAAGHEVAVVVSAMAGVTAQLVDYVDCSGPIYDTREYDCVVSAGEQITAGLMALRLQALGIPARSWLGWQLPIHTDEVHGKARIRDIDTAHIRARFDEAQVAVIPGFQGLSPNGRVTTLGRGGSDITAVALAAALDADLCDIYTDVDGIYTCDPRIVPQARKLSRISHEEMLEMASLGARVLQPRSVEIAMVRGVRLRVRSSFGDGPGTLVADEDDIVEKQIVSGITYSRDEAKISLIGVADTPGVAASVFGPLSDAAINVDMIVQSVSADGKRADITFTVTADDLNRTVAILEDRRDAVRYRDLRADANVVKLSVIGIGMRSHAGVAQTMFRTLADKGINIQAISTSEIKISTLVAEEYVELALRALHSAYGLDDGGTAAAAAAAAAESRDGN